MRDERRHLLSTLREIEKQARELGEELPHGVERHRARQIAILAAHVALTMEIERNGRARVTADGAGRNPQTSPA
jgi:hypothetical protein